MKRRFLALVLAGCLAAVLSTTAWASETPTSVSTEMELTTALGDTAVTSIQLKGNIDISNTLVVTKDVTLDLNGFVLQHENRDANDSVIKIESGTLTLVDSNPDAIHKFVKNTDDLWMLDESQGAGIVRGGIITGGIGREHSFSSVYGSISENGGGGVFINQDASFVMEGGNIVGCSAVGEHNTAGGVLVARSASFVMKAEKSQAAPQRGAAACTWLTVTETMRLAALP